MAPLDILLLPPLTVTAHPFNIITLHPVYRMAQDPCPVIPVPLLRNYQTTQGSNIFSSNNSSSHHVQSMAGPSQAKECLLVHNLARHTLYLQGLKCSLAYCRTAFQPKQILIFVK